MPTRDAAAPPLEIRTARDDERDAVRDLTHAAYAEYATIMDPRAWRGLDRAITRALATPDQADWIVALDESRVVGSVLLFPADADAYPGVADAIPWPELRLLAVAPEARSRGVGRALVDECARRARASGAAALGLHTSRSMAAARRLYERLGFIRESRHDFQPPGAELVEGFRLDLR